MNGLNQYRNYQVETAASEDQIVLLYDGARRFVDKALLALEAHDYEGVSVSTGKAQRIFAELAAALNHGAGDIASNLSALYEYWTWRLSQGLIKQDAAAFAEVSATLVDLHAAWAEAARQVRAQRGSHAIG